MRYFYMNRMEDYYILLKLCNIDFIGRIGQKENLLNQIIDEIMLICKSKLIKSID